MLWECHVLLCHVNGVCPALHTSAVVTHFSISSDSLEHITVDESRHILYTLSSKGAIHVYDLGSEGRSVDRVAAMSLDAVVHRAVQATKYVCIRTYVHMCGTHKMHVICM